MTRTVEQEARVKAALAALGPADAAVTTAFLEVEALQEALEAAQVALRRAELVRDGAERRFEQAVWNDPTR